MPHPLDVEAIVTASRSDVGRTRTENQDSCGDFRHTAGARLLILADGMGGHNGGRFASRACVDAFARVFAEHRGSPETQLRASFDLANHEIYEASCGDEELRGMGTTSVALLFCRDGSAVLGWVGDSRAYRWRRGTLEQLTLDHALVAEWVRSGVLSPEEAKEHPRRSELTRAIGISPEVAPEVEALELQAGDRFLLCSDGLSGLVSDDEIGLVLSGEDPDRAVQTLVDRANALGGTDNVSVQIALLPAEPPTQPEAAPSEEETEPEQQEAEAPAAIEEPPPVVSEPAAAPPPPVALTRLLYVTDPRAFHPPSALIGAGLTAVVLTLGHYAFTQLSRDLDRLSVPHAEASRTGEPAPAEVVKGPDLELPPSPIELADGTSFEPEPMSVSPSEPSIPATVPVTDPSSVLSEPTPSHPASPRPLDPGPVAGEIPNAGAFALDPALRGFLDQWLRALATRDFALYQQLGFPDSRGAFDQTYRGRESFRLEDARLEPMRGTAERIYVSVLLSYVFENEQGRWRTEDTHRLILLETAEGLRYEARWK